MDDILKNLQDPSWWFTVWVAGIIIAFGCGLLITPTERKLATISSWYEARSAIRRARREAAVTALATNPQYLTIAYLRVLETMLFCLGTFLALVLLHVKLLTAQQETYRLYVAPEFLPEGYWIVVGGVLTLGLLVIGYRAGKRLSVVGAAVRKYRKDNGLPRLL